jgi:glycosyltransferase involved in cell wall biosynthesis
MDATRLRKKLLCIHHGRGIGGASLELLYLLQKLDRNKFELKVLCVHNSEAVDLFKHHGIDVRVLNGWRGFGHSEVGWIKWNRPDLLLLVGISWLITACRYGREILREEKPDLLYLNSTPLSAWAIAAKVLNIPVVCHVREPITEGYFGIRKFFLRSVLKNNVDRFIAVSKQNARALDLPKQTEVIYGFVHVDQFNPNIPPAEIPQTVAKGRKIALYLGGSATIKGFRVMVDALQHLEPGIVVLFGGYYGSGRIWKDPLRRIFKPNLARTYRKLSSAPNAVTVGIRLDVPQWIAACDVLVAPFAVPHFARPAVEAAAMAKPVVASDVEGMEELVVDEQTGVLVPAGDPKALADAINRLCGDKCLAASMGKAGYQRARALFEGHKNTEATFEVFHELLNSYESVRGEKIRSAVKIGN